MQVLQSGQLRCHCNVFFFMHHKPLVFDAVAVQIDRDSLLQNGDLGEWFTRCWFVVA